MANDSFSDTLVAAEVVGGGDGGGDGGGGTGWGAKQKNITINKTT